MRSQLAEISAVEKCVFELSVLMNCELVQFDHKQTFDSRKKYILILLVESM